MLLDFHRNSLEYFISDFHLPIMLLRIFQVSRVLVLQFSSLFCNSSSCLDVRVLLTCFCTFCSDFLLILTYLSETLSAGYLSLCRHFLTLLLTKVHNSVLFFLYTWLF